MNLTGVPAHQRAERAAENSPASHHSLSTRGRERSSPRAENTLKRTRSTTPNLSESLDRQGTRPLGIRNVIVLEEHERLIPARLTQSRCPLPEHLGRVVEPMQPNVSPRRRRMHRRAEVLLFDPDHGDVVLAQHANGVVVEPAFVPELDREAWRPGQSIEEPVQPLELLLHVRR